MAPESSDNVDSVTSYVNDVLACYSEVCSFPSLGSSPEVNDAFTKLVSLSSQTPNDALTANVGSPSCT